MSERTEFLREQTLSRLDLAGVSPERRLFWLRGWEAFAASGCIRRRGEATGARLPRLRVQQLGALGPRAVGPVPDLRARQIPGQFHPVTFPAVK